MLSSGNIDPQLAAGHVSHLDMGSQVSWRPYVHQDMGQLAEQLYHCVCGGHLVLGLKLAGI
jgi:hypothetical protein